MNYVELTFQNAALCLEAKKKDGRVSDYVYDSSVQAKGKRWMNRGEHEKAKDSILNIYDEKLFDKKPIGFEQVSNMLHVLCGVRPVSTFKVNPFKRKRLEAIDNIAKNVWVKIDNIYYTEKDGKKKPIGDFTQGKKFVHNANRKDLSSPLGNNKFVKGSYITWGTLWKKYYFTDKDKYDRIINQLKAWYGGDGMEDKYSLCSLMLYLANVKDLKNEMAVFFEKEKMTPFVQLIEGGIKLNSINAIGDGNNNNYNLARLPVNTTPCSKLYLNGTMIIPIENDIVFYLIVNGVRNCTFLEGGKVSIKYTTDFFDLNWLEMNGYEQIFQENVVINN